jgi:DNA helicase HerA-like ATPase
MQRIDTKRAAAIHFRCGSSGTGKSWGVKEAIKGQKRLIVFDPDGEYDQIAGIKTATSAAQLIAFVTAAGNKPLKVRFYAQGEKAFSIFCRVAFAWCNCCVVAEEIAGVTSPAKAPKDWHILISRGRKRGIVLYAVTQRPAEADKTVIGNATTIRTGRLSRAADRKYLAAEMDVHIQHINALKEQEYVESDMVCQLKHIGKMGQKKVIYL